MAGVAPSSHGRYDSAALRPYIIFMVFSHKVYHRTGFLSLHAQSGKLQIDTSKTMEVLDAFADCFLRVLAAMDARDGAALERVLYAEMAPEDTFVRSVVALVQSDQQGAFARRPERGCACHPSWSLPACDVCAPCS